MEIGSFLIAFVVSFGLAPVQSNNQMGKIINDDGQAQQNLRHFFDSITQNDMEKTKNYRNILGQEAAREQEAFNTVKGELKLARQRHAFHISDDNLNDRRTVFKREAEDTPTSAEIAAAAAKKEAEEARKFEDMTPEELEKEADFKSKEADREREEADILRNQADRHDELAEKMRCRAEKKHKEAAEELRNEADRLLQSGKDTPEKIVRKRLQADDFSREAEDLRRRAENLRSDLRAAE